MTITLTREEAQKLLDGFERVGWARTEHADILRARLAQPEPDAAYGYASRLAEAIYQKHYRQDSPEWKPLDDTLGVLTQIDNMTCRLVKAQPEPFCKNGSQCIGGKCPQCVVEEPEPVAWMFPDDLERFETSETFAEAYSIARLSVTKGETVPLYTSPPQREWQGLTDEEVAQIWLTVLNFKEYHRAIEAKLKEKNSG